MIPVYKHYFNHNGALYNDDTKNKMVLHEHVVTGFYVNKSLIKSFILYINKDDQKMIVKRFVNINNYTEITTNIIMPN